MILFHRALLDLLSVFIATPLVGCGLTGLAPDDGDDSAIADPAGQEGSAAEGDGDEAGASVAGEQTAEAGESAGAVREGGAEGGPEGDADGDSAGEAGGDPDPDEPVARDLAPPTACPADDVFAPNDIPAQATKVEWGWSAEGLVLCSPPSASAKDWYRLDLSDHEDGRTLSVRIVADLGTAWLELAIFRTDDPTRQGRALSGDNYLEAGAVALDVPAADPGTYLLKVDNEVRGTVATYSLEVLVPQ